MSPEDVKELLQLAKQMPPEELKQMAHKAGQMSPSELKQMLSIAKQMPAGMVNFLGGFMGGGAPTDNYRDYRRGGQR